MKISVVIPAYNEEKYIGNTLKSVKNMDLGGNELELLVIDGDSNDKTAEVAKSYGATVKHEPHKGIGFARQQGIKNATGDIILFTDADTIVPRDYLLKHVKELSRTNVVFTFGNFRVPDGKFPYYHYVNYLQPVILWVSFHLFGIPYAAGQNMGFWREKALKIGGFDDKIGLFEDIDFAIRMKKAGKLVFIPSLYVVSSGRRSNEGWKFHLRMVIVNFKYFSGSRDLGGFKDYR